MNEIEVINGLIVLAIFFGMSWIIYKLGQWHEKFKNRKSKTKIGTIMKPIIHILEDIEGKEFEKELKNERD